MDYPSIYYLTKALAICFGTPERLSDMARGQQNLLLHLVNIFHTKCLILAGFFETYFSHLVFKIMYSISL
jgi:hypothetical protein